MAETTPSRTISLISILFLLLTTAPEPTSSFPFSFAQYRTVVSLSHSLMTRVANLRASRGDISGSRRAHLIAEKLEPGLGLGFFGHTWSLGWDYLKNYAWRDLNSAELYGVVSDVNELLKSAGELTRANSDAERSTWVGRNYQNVLGVSTSLFKKLLKVFTKSGTLRKAVKVMERELVQGDLLRDCLELGGNDLKGVRRPHLERAQKAILYSYRTFHFLVTLRRLATWGLSPDPSDEAIAHEVTVKRRMTTMKQNKGKDAVDDGTGPGAKFHPCPASGDKRKSLSLGVDLGNLPSRRKDKKARHRSSKPQDVQAKDQPSSLLVPPSHPVQILDVDPEFPPPLISSRVEAPTSSQPSHHVPYNLLENEDLAWEKFERVVTDEDVMACYNMSLKDFERSSVHDFFKAMSKFIAASRQATKLDKTRVLLEKTVQKGRDESKRWAEVAAKAKDDVENLQNRIVELETEVHEKNARLDFLQKRNDELDALLEKARGDANANTNTNTNDWSDL